MERTVQTSTLVRAYDALDAATRVIAGLGSVDEVLQIIVDEVRPLVGARYAALGIVDDQGVIEHFITSGIDAETRAAIGPLPRGHGFLALIVAENRSIRILDIETDPRRYGFPPNHPPMHSFLGVPVAVKGRSVGNLYMTDRDGGQGFTAADQDLAETFARHAAIAIENARLYEQIRRLAVVDERERISKDLHDGIIQNIYAVGLSLEDVPELMADDPQEVVARVERAIDSLHHTIRDIRNFIMGLRPELLSGMTLTAGIAVIVEAFRHDSLIEVEWHSVPFEPEPSPDATAHLLGIVNEALSNIARHAGATQAWIDVDVDAADRLRIKVIDDGHGFDPATVGTLGHQGLANMRSRAAGIGASITVASSPAGTTVEILLPSEPALARSGSAPA